LNTRLKCLLLDDELPGLTYLKMLCEQIPELEVVKAFNNPLTFLQEVPQLAFDLCILDIEMPEMSGLEVANLLGGKPVIFTTAYRDYAAEAFDLDAVDYVRKPVQKERLQQAVQKILLRLPKPVKLKTRLQWNTDKGKAMLDFAQIRFIRTADQDSRDKFVSLADGSSLVLKNISFDKLRSLLPPGEFCQINKKELIALSIVSFFSHQEVTTTLMDATGKNLRFILSESFRNDFLQQVNIQGI
jgi:DNA-binding LytR/AlgR family response regulator